jgi:hypothetical protein
MDLKGLSGLKEVRWLGSRSKSIGGQHFLGPIHKISVLRLCLHYYRIYHVIVAVLSTLPPRGYRTFCLHLTTAVLFGISKWNVSPKHRACSGINPFSSMPSSSISMIHCTVLPQRRLSHMPSLQCELSMILIASRRKIRSRHFVPARKSIGSIRYSKQNTSMPITERDLLAERRKGVIKTLVTYPHWFLPRTRQCRELGKQQIQNVREGYHMLSLEFPNRAKVER